MELSALRTATKKKKDPSKLSWSCGGKSSSFRNSQYACFSLLFFSALPQSHLNHSNFLYISIFYSVLFGLGMLVDVAKYHRNYHQVVLTSDRSRQI